MTPARADKIGKYFVEREIGRGGMGLVYKAVDPDIGRLVAIKMVTAGSSADPDALKRFYREAKSTGRLQHPNIVTLHDLGEHDGIPYLVMEFLEGESLDKIISARRALSLSEKLSLILKVCDGLSYAHEHGIIHRDIKPANIMVLSDGGVKLVDFGIARFGNERQTLPGQVIGTLSYMSPEQISGGDIDARSDIYSTAVVLYELLSGVCPFEGTDYGSTLWKIIHDPPPPLPKFLKACPPELDQTIQHALAKSRVDRYSSIEDFQFDLQRVQEHSNQELISSYLETAEACIQVGDWNKAKENVRQVLKLDRQHRHAGELMRRIQIEIQRQQLSEQLQQLRIHAEEALALRQWDQALAYLDEAVKLDSNNQELVEWRESIRRSSVQLADALRRAESARDAGDLEGAKKALDEALAVDEANTTARALNAILAKEMAERSRKKFLSSLISDAKQEIDKRHFTGAIEILRNAERMDGSSAEIQQLLRFATAAQEQEKRRKALEQICTEVEDLLNRDKYGEACAKAESGLRTFPDDNGLLKLKIFAEKQRNAWAKRIYVEAQLAAANQLIEAGDLGEAVSTLKAASDKYPDEPSLTSLMAIAREAISRERLLREEQSRKKRDDQYINETIAKARERMAANQTTQSLEILQIALSRFPGNADLLAESAVVTAALTRHKLQQERRQALTTELRSARQLLSNGQTEAALANLRVASHRYPDSEELHSLIAICNEQRTAELQKEAQKQQEQAYMKAAVTAEITSARQMIALGHIEDAIDSLTAATKRLTEVPELEAELTAAREALRDKRLIQPEYGAVGRRNQLRDGAAINSATQFFTPADDQTGSDREILITQGPTSSRDQERVGRNQLSAVRVPASETSTQLHGNPPAPRSHKTLGTIVGLAAAFSVAFGVYVTTHKGNASNRTPQGEMLNLPAPSPGVSKAPERTQSAPPMDSETDSDGANTANRQRKQAPRPDNEPNTRFPVQQAVGRTRQRDQEDIGRQTVQPSTRSNGMAHTAVEPPIKPEVAESNTGAEVSHAAASPQPPPPPTFSKQPPPESVPGASAPASPSPQAPAPQIASQQGAASAPTPREVARADIPPLPSTTLSSSQQVSPEDGKDIQSLLGRYADSFSRKDAKAIQALWPGIPKERLSSIKAAFKLNTQLTFSGTTMVKEGDRVLVKCTQSVRAEIDGKTQTHDSRMTIYIVKRGSGWLIDYIPLNN